MSDGMSGYHETPWRPPASLRRHGWRWMFAPLIAFAIFAVGPSVLAPIFYILHSTVDLTPLIGRPHHAPSLLAILFEPLVLALGLWPFLWLYGYVRDKLIAQPAEWRSIRLATLVSTVAMSLPSTLFLVGTPQEMMSSAPDAGQGTGIAVFWFMLLLPIPGVIGWLIGRGIASLLRD
jgi:hypothetical protein